jgi:DNA repair exonuclease SbcCD ATPase subunit
VIPLSVRLKGFLCYRDEQRLDLDSSSSLWLLSGLNGSGKSAIFDAMTYALFGHHRGGGQQALELINKDSDGLLVEFDFLLDGDSYRIKRTLKRTAKGGSSGTQQIFKNVTSGEGKAGRWHPIEGTESRRDGFDPWVRDHIGLTYDTFTSSVLLLQGRAEKLLDSKPEGRREVLASIVDLERYERLHRLADDARKRYQAQLETLTNRLAALPNVSPEELQSAEKRIEAAEAARTASRKEVERLQGLEFQARGWVELQNKLAQLTERHKQSQKLLSDAAAIEKTFARLRELRDVLPHVEVLLREKATMSQAEQKVRDLEIVRKKAAGDLAAKDNLLKQTRDKRTQMQGLITTEENRYRDVVKKLRDSTTLMEKLKQAERQEGDLARLDRELGDFPADLAERTTKARDNVDRLTALNQAVPLLTRLASRRDELRSTTEREKQVLDNQQVVRTRGEQAKADVERLKPLVESTARQLQEASDRATEARTLLQQARDHLKEITQLGGSKVCRHCGQELTAGHLKEENRRRKNAVNAAEEKSRTAQDAWQVARQEDQQLRDKLATAEQVREDARVEWRDCVNQVAQVRADARRLQEECGQLHGDLPEPYRARVSHSTPADWLAVAWPAEADLAALRRESAGLAAARQEWALFDQQLQRLGTLHAQRTSLLQTLTRVHGELPADRAGLREQHANLEVEEQTLQKNLEARRKDLLQIDADLDRLAREREQASDQVQKIAGQIRDQELTRQHAEQTVSRTHKLLPKVWQDDVDKVGLRAWSIWNQEKDELEKSGAEKRAQELEQARRSLATLLADRTALETQQLDFPEEAREGVEAIRARLTAARLEDKRCDDELAQARQHHALLLSHRRQREELEAEYLQVDGEHAHAKLLAELLGKDRLQLHLVRQAERQVVDYANAVLDRLSGGQLYLKLVGEANGEGASAKALELEAYNRTTGDKPINVAFLSGSQKFRVAVSLALGIGQYASRQHRPIESVIIDEGFGCLDRQGRQVMIQELQNLRSQMRCILLVSHQEEFADAFSNGYHFELEDGATRVRRIQK